MHIGRHIVQELVLEFGAPGIERWSVPLPESEYRYFEAEVARGRAHDVSLLIVRDGQAALTKPTDHENALTLPSGAIHPEESFVDGAMREALAHTGLSVVVVDYILQVHASFELDGEAVKWVSHVMLANPKKGSTSAQPEVVDPERLVWLDGPSMGERARQMLDGRDEGTLRYQARLLDRVSALF